MASILSSLYQTPTLNPNPTSPVPLPHLRPSHCSLRNSLSHPPSFVACGVAAPNSVLSEEAFKGLGGRFGKADVEEEEDVVEEEGGGEDVLAIANLGLPQVLVDSLQNRGITHLFPIQRAVLVPALEGLDLIARAKTGTGKTLAFGIPILKRLTVDEEGRSISRRAGRLPRVLVLAPY